ncbi:VanW family protein [Clostridium folliculivorans]|uniref:Exported protein n=1 Tax=Clostridium folliculivorans TaxID=2886038 RepID=A0A9W5Y6M0_9CLOT|nr:VanW family protein [Clostridium folliculivorans]GKU27696.1 exported protein [Clostridium folliculivorans]GKU32456.1 exported protein [Clostridium folliculivorans]
MLSRAKRNNNMKSLIIAATAGVIVVGVSAITYWHSIENYVKQWDNKIYSRVRIEGIDLSGKSKAEAVQLLNDELRKLADDKKIIVKVQEKKFQLDYKTIKPQYDIETAVNEALKYGKDKGLLDRKRLIKSGPITNINLNFKYDSEELNKFEKSIASKIDKKPKDASINIINQSITINEEQSGAVLNKELLDKSLKEALTGSWNKDISVNGEIKVANAKITKEQLSRIDGVLASFSTDYSTSTEARANNIAIAAKACNGKVVMPGEVFSYNKTLGERTYEKGYMEAPIYKNNEVVDDVGGGICQVSTTLYRAAMRANLKAVERHNHSFKATYSPLGLDATVTWGYLDYKFKNTYDFPIYIEAMTSGRSVSFNIYGSKAGLGSKRYDLVSDAPVVIQAMVNEVNDPTLPEGQIVMDEKPIDGYKVKSYLVTYENGKEIAREAVAYDTYIKKDGVRRIGTKRD